MSLTAVTTLTAAVLLGIVALIVVVTRRVIRTVPGEGRAIGELVAELRRANDLAERRLEALEGRVQSLEDRLK